jgi:hypothetical protein
MCRHHWLITQYWFNNAKIVKQRAEGHGFTFAKYEISHLLQWPWTWVYFHEISNVTSFAMATKASHTTSHEIVLSPPCSQWKRCIPLGSKGWLQMQCDTIWTKIQKRLNLVRNAVEKTFESKWKKGMIGWANNQVPTLGPTHNIKSVQCELKGK